MDQGQPNGARESPLNITQYKKTVASIAWIQLSLAVLKLFINRVRTGHGKLPGKSWNFRTSFSRPGKSWNLGVVHDVY